MGLLIGRNVQVRNAAGLKIFRGGAEHVPPGHEILHISPPPPFFLPKVHQPKKNVQNFVRNVCLAENVVLHEFH